MKKLSGQSLSREIHRRFIAIWQPSLTRARLLEGRCDKGKPVARRGRKALVPLLRGSSRAAEQQADGTLRGFAFWGFDKEALVDALDIPETSAPPVTGG